MTSHETKGDAADGGDARSRLQRKAILVDGKRQVAEMNQRRVATERRGFCDDTLTSYYIRSAEDLAERIAEVDQAAADELVESAEALADAALRFPYVVRWSFPGSHPDVEECYDILRIARGEAALWEVCTRSRVDKKTRRALAAAEDGLRAARDLANHTMDDKALRLVADLCSETKKFLSAIRENLQKEDG